MTKKRRNIVIQKDETLSGAINALSQAVPTHDTGTTGLVYIEGYCATI